MRNDLKLDENGDLSIENGDFVITESDTQHVNHLLQAVKGDYKLNPTTGCNLIDFVKKTDNYKKIEYEIRTQLEADGYELVGISIDKDNFNIDFNPNYDE